MLDRISVLVPFASVPRAVIVAAVVGVIVLAGGAFFFGRAVSDEEPPRLEVHSVSPVRDAGRGERLTLPAPIRIPERVER